MNAKHTPGPWRIDEDEYGHRLFCDEYHGVCAGKGFFPEGFRITGYMSHADARLIAAAPELLEALRLMLIPVDAIGNHGGTEWGYSSRHAQAARAAILKATGEAS
jgi:hypothetical protein